MQRLKKNIFFRIVWLHSRSFNLCFVKSSIQWVAKTRKTEITPHRQEAIHLAFGKQLGQMSGQEHLVVAKSYNDFHKHSQLLGTYSPWDQQIDLGHVQFLELLEAGD